MKKQKWLILITALMMVFSLASCSGSNTTAANTEAVTEEASETKEEAETEEASETKEEVENEEETKTTETEDAAETDTADQEEEEEPSTDETKTDAEESTEPAAVAETGAYVDFDDMSFYVNGTKYTLGVSTLQDMIDDGVPFDEDDLANAGNNLNSNCQSSRFKIVLDKYWNAQVYVLNDTDENKITSECYINEIYLPVKSDKTQDILSFAFPLNITMEELVATAGNPDESSHYDGDNGYYTDTYKYIKESEKYYQDSKYTFEFMNGELNYITIEYMP